MTIQLYKKYVLYDLFVNINRLFNLSFKNCHNDFTANFFVKCYMPLVEVKFKDFYYHHKAHIS